MQLLLTTIVAGTIPVVQRPRSANLEFCMLFGNGSFVSANGRKLFPTVPSMGAAALGLRKYLLLGLFPMGLQIERLRSSLLTPGGSVTQAASCS